MSPGRRLTLLLEPLPLQSSTLKATGRRDSGSPLRDWVWALQGSNLGPPPCKCPENALVRDLSWSQRHS